MNINLTPEQYYYALYLAQLELIEREKEQGSLTKLSQKLYDAYEKELDRVAPNRNAMIVQ
jgi:hypothetical protein